MEKNNLQIYTPHNLTQHRKADLGIRGQGIMIGSGATLQMRGAQLVTGGGAENITATLEFVAA